MDIKAFVKKYRWMLAGVVVVILGYQFGKDLAFKHNAEDKAESRVETS